MYTGYSKQDELFVANENKGNSPKLEPGVYSFECNPMTGMKYFTKIKTNHDKLVDLPNTKYDTVISEITHFLKPQTKDTFDKYGFLYKRSALLYGPPGTGKTCIVNRVIETVVQNKGVVLFNLNPDLAGLAFAILEDTQPETTTMVVFEELDKLLQRHEGTLLNLLDGEIQKNNMVVLGTTNYIEQIPPRIRRPGRFSSVLEVDYPSYEARLHYLNIKLENKSEALEWAQQTAGRSIDELKELVLSVKCLNYTFNDSLSRIKEARPDGTVLAPEKKDRDQEDNCDEDPYYVSSIAKAMGRKGY